MRLLDTIGVGFVFFMLGVFVPVRTFAPAIHGTLYPVVGLATMGAYTPDPPPEYRYTWKASAEKYVDCDFSYVEWNLGPRDGHHVPVPAEFIDPPEVRPTGRLEWERLRISLSPQTVIENSFGFVYHDCGYPWLVRSVFYDSQLREGTQ